MSSFIGTQDSLSFFSDHGHVMWKTFGQDENSAEKDQIETQEAKVEEAEGAEVRTCSGWGFDGKQWIFILLFDPFGT